MLTIVAKTQDKGSSTLGGKASGLVKLFEHGITIPMTVILDMQTLQEACTNTQKMKDIISSLNLSSDKRYAVRSSVDVEDGAMLSYAGLFYSYLNVQLNELPGVVAKYFNSMQGMCATISNYDASRSNDFKSALILQEMIYPSISGICFTANPQTNNRNEFMIEICEGLSEGLTSGEIIPVNVIVSKINGEILNISGISEDYDLLDFFYLNKSQFLSNCMLIESIYKTAVDIEWAMKENQVYFLQVRPITTVGHPNE